jgi:hypothetical protein
MMSSCGAIYNVTHTKDLSADFSKYVAYAWLPDLADTAGQPFNEIIRNNIKNYVGRSLTERGMVAELDSPDVLLRLVVKTSKKRQVMVSTAYTAGFFHHRYYLGSIYYHPYPVSYYYRNYYGYFPPVLWISKVNYDQGEVTIEMYDRITNIPVWKGSATVDVFNTTKLNKHIHPAVQAIMKKFPVKVYPPHVPEIDHKTVMRN